MNISRYKYLSLRLVSQCYYISLQGVFSASICIVNATNSKCSGLTIGEQNFKVHGAGKKRHVASTYTLKYVAQSCRDVNTCSNL